MFLSFLSLSFHCPFNFLSFPFIVLSISFPSMFLSLLSISVHCPFNFLSFPFIVLPISFPFLSFSFHFFPFLQSPFLSFHFQFKSRFSMIFLDFTLFEAALDQGGRGGGLLLGGGHYMVLYRCIMVSSAVSKEKPVTLSVPIEHL